MSTKTNKNAAPKRSETKQTAGQNLSQRNRTKRKPYAKNRGSTVMSVARKGANGTSNYTEIMTIPNVGMKEMKEWIANHYSLDQCFLIPREQRAYVQPHKWNFSNNFITEFCEGNISRVAVKMRPSVNEFLSLGRPSDVEVVKPFDSGQEDESEYPSFKSSQLGSGITFDERIKLVNGLFIKAGLVENPPGVYRYLDSGELKLGCKMYPGAIKAGWDGKIRATFYNPDNAAAGCTGEVFALRQEINGNIIEEGATSVTIPANGAADIVFGVIPGPYEVAKSFGFGFRITNSDVIGNMPSGFTMKMGFNSDGTTIEGPMVWRSYDVWEVISDPTGALRKQYESSNFHCFTAMHATLTNTQAKIYQGGSIQAAQLSGLSEDKIPHTFDALDTWIGNRTYDVNKEKELSKGLHWNYRWEKVQDTFFIRNDFEAETSVTRPSMVATLTAPAITSETTNQKISIQLSGSVMLEYITEVRDAPVFLAPADTVNLLARYCAARAELPCLFENPTHWDALKKNVAKLCNNPVIRTVAKEAAIAGLKLMVV